MDSKNKIVAVILGCATYFSSVWAVGAWMYGQGEKAGRGEDVAKLIDENSRLHKQVEMLERESDEYLREIEGPSGAFNGTDFDDHPDDCSQLRAEVDELRGKVALKELPSEVAARVELLAEPGYWKPEMETGTANLLKADAVYGDGRTPQPHSLMALKGIGVLDNSTQGAYALYTVLAIGSDTERTRHQAVFNLAYNRGWPASEEQRRKQFAQDDGTRAIWRSLEEVQEALRDYGDELVAAGILAK